MSGIKNMLNWFVTIETDEKEEVPEEAANPDPEVAAKAALERAEQGPVGKPVNPPRQIKAMNIDTNAGRLPNAGLGELSKLFDSDPILASPDDIYTSHGLTRSDTPGFHIFKVEDLLGSKHLTGLDNRVKRASILVALEANQVTVETVIQDAVARDNALDQHEEMLCEEITELENEITQRNHAIESEIEAFLKGKQLEIAENRQRLEEKQAAFAEWRTIKQREEERLSNAVSGLVNPETNPITRS